MNIWEILGIEYTTDKEAIKRAYRAKLSVTNPEDDQKAFIQLRRAYEEANEQADRGFTFSDSYGFFEDDEDGYEEGYEDEEADEVREFEFEEDDYEEDDYEYDKYYEDEKTDDEILKLKNIPKYWRNRGEASKKDKAREKLSTLYNSYSKRVNPDCWKKLLSDEVFSGVDITGEVFDTLMNFIIEKYYLPKAVWKVIVEHFNIKENREELIVNYSENIIDMMISNASHEDKNAILNESEYGSLRDNYLELLEINPYDKNARAGMMKANSALLEQYIKLLESEPDNIRANIELARCYFYDYQYEEALGILKDLNPAREDLCDFYHIHGMLYFTMKKYELALEIFLKWKNFLEGVAYHTSRVNYINELKKFGYVNYLIGECYLGLRDYEKASEYIEKNIFRNHRDKVRISESRCKLYYEEGKYTLCISTCRSLLEDVEENYVAYVYLAKASFMLKEFDATIFYAQEAKKMCIYLPEPYHILARFYIAERRFDEATDILDEFTKLTIRSDGVIYYEARIKYFEEKFDEALVSINMLLARYNPRTTDFHDYKQLLFLKSECLEKLKRYNDAIQSYERILELYPDDNVVNARIAYVYEKKAKELGNFRENMLAAVKYMRAQMDIAVYTSCVFDMAGYFEAVGQTANAIYSYNKCIEFDEPNYGKKVYGPLMYLYRLTDSIDDAIYCANKKIELEETEREKKDLYKFLGALYESKNDLQSAKETYLEYEAMFGTDVEVSAYKARILYRQGQVAEAIKQLEGLIRNNSYDGQVKVAYLLLCDMYGDIGNLKAAKSIYDFASSKAKGDCEITAALGEAYYRNNKYERARKYYLIAHNQDTQDRFLYLVNLCELYSENTFLYGNLLSQELHKIKFRQEYVKYRRDVIPQIKFTRMINQFDITRNIVQGYKKVPRCPNCPYKDCHKFLFEMGRFNERNGGYDSAMTWFNDLLEVCPDNPYYKKYVEEFQKKHKKGE